MPARDALHDAVRHALERDGWTITHDPLRLSVRRRNLYVDLGAERLLAAEKGRQKIAVEIKTFAGPSDVKDLEMPSVNSSPTNTRCDGPSLIGRCIWPCPSPRGSSYSPNRSAKS